MDVNEEKTTIHWWREQNVSLCWWYWLARLSDWVGAHDTKRDRKRDGKIQRLQYRLFCQFALNSTHLVCNPCVWLRHLSETIVLSFSLSIDFFSRFWDIDRRRKRGSSSWLATPPLTAELYPLWRLEKFDVLCAHIIQFILLFVRRYIALDWLTPTLTMKLGWCSLFIP